VEVDQDGTRLILEEDVRAGSSARRVGRYEVVLKKSVWLLSGVYLFAIQWLAVVSKFRSLGLLGKHGPGSRYRTIITPASVAISGPGYPLF
jgi:hypothetical protein